MANCVHCGHALPEQAAFCIECGKPRSSAPVLAATPPPSPTASSSRAPWMAAGLIGLAMLGAGLRFWWNSPRPTVSSTPPAAAPAQPPPPPIVETPRPQPPPPPIPTQMVTPTPEPTRQEPTVLYQSQRDLDGDGQPEQARVISLEGNPEPNSTARKQFQILSGQGDLRFVSEPFEEPFHTDMDDLAESPEGKAGLHILAGSSEYPRIRLIFTARSGNFVDFHFNGQQFELAEIGD